MNITDALDAELADLVNRHPECSPLEIADSLLTVAVVVAKRTGIQDVMLIHVRARAVAKDAVTTNANARRSP